MVACDTLPRYIVCGAVVDRGAYYGKPQCGVHAVLEVHEVRGPEPLVVVHGDHAVELFFPHGPVEDGIRRQRACCVYARLPRLLYGRRDYPSILVAEHPGLSGVRVQAAYCYPRPLHGEVLPEGPVSDPDGI